MPTPPPPDPTAATATTTADPDAPRERLLHAALRLFAAAGYAGTTTRELAQAAGVNIAAISYYFGDKQGLYRAAFCEPFGDTQAEIARFMAPAPTLHAQLRQYYQGFLAPLAMGEAAHHAMKLHLREMVEPTGMWQQEIDQSIRPMHEALVSILAKHLQAKPDTEMHRLAHMLAAMPVYLFVGHDVLRTLHPALLQGSEVVPTWSTRLADYAEALVLAEGKRRAAPIKTNVKPKTKTVQPAKAPARKKTP